MAGKRMADSGDLGYTPPADRHRVARPRHGYVERPLGPSDEDRLRWQRFLAELPERIAHIRAEEAPLLCPTCGSTTTTPASGTKWCPRCRADRPVIEFNRNAARYDGLAPFCRACKRKDDKNRRKNRALRALGIAS